MDDKPKMRWSRTDVNEDFDKNVLQLSRMRPLAGKGFYTTLRNLIYMQAPEPYTLTPKAWEDIKLAMNIGRPKFEELLKICMEIGLFDREHYEATGEITSRRIRQEIGGRFGDMERADRHRNKDCDNGCDSGCDSSRDTTHTGNSNIYTGNRKTGNRRNGGASSAPSDHDTRIAQAAKATMEEKVKELTKGG